MTNINNNNNINTSKTNYSQSVAHKKDNNEQFANAVESPNVENTDSDYSAIIGRSQVRFKSKNDNFENDIKLFIENPKSVEKANTFFNIAYEQAVSKKQANPYEYAALLAREYYNEANK